MVMLSALPFVHSFCADDRSDARFPGDLAGWTPCAIDLELGVAHVLAVLFYLLWLRRVVGAHHSRYRPEPGWPRRLHASCCAAAAAAAAVPLLQLNARLAQQALPLSAGAIAPHEWLGLLAAAASFALLSAVLLAEAEGRLVLAGRWILRWPVTVVAASELVKLRFVLQQEAYEDEQQRYGYFFWLYCGYVGLQAFLSATLLIAFRGPDHLQLVQEGRRPLLPARAAAAGAAPAAAAAGERVCPEWRAGPWAAVTFSWLSPLVRSGYRRPLSDSDVWDLPPPDRVQAVERRFRDAWRAQLDARGPARASLFAACRATVGGLFLSALPFKLVNDASQFVGPLILNQLLSVVAARGGAGGGSGSGGSSPNGAWWPPGGALRGGDPLQDGYVLAALLFLGTVLGVLADNQHFQRVMRAGFRVKSVLTAEVYRKVLLLSPAERSHLTAGKIFNLVSSDANTLADFCANAFGFMSAPLRIVVTMVLLCRQLGLSALVAVACIAAAVPANSQLVRASAAQLQVALRHGDTRAKMESELVTGIEVVKASAWEAPFASRIGAARAQELAVLYRVTLLQSLMGVLVNAIPTVVPVVTFLAYLLVMKQPLSAAQAFTALSLFNILRFPLFQLPQIVTQATQARVALRRLKDMLAAAEVQSTAAGVAAGAQEEGGGAGGAATPAAPSDEQQQQQGLQEEDQEAAPVAIRLQGDFSWAPDKPPSLTDLNLEVPRGALVAVVGPTGSGKSSLLSAMLGQLLGVTGDEEASPEAASPEASPVAPAAPAAAPGSPQPRRRRPQAQVFGSTAYVPQAPFILGGTVRDNVTFGRRYDPGQYEAAVRAAQLLPDLAALPGGDLTELGDRGTNVSGGQKQRICIARALYASADVVLLDDPLSALDARVGRAVAQQAIKQALASRTVVLATNQLQFVSMADLVVVMRGGAAAEVGTYAQLMAAGGLLAEVMQEAQAEEADDQQRQQPEQQPQQLAAAPGGGAAAKPAAAAAAAPAAAAGGKLVQEESSATGGVSWAVVRRYLGALGGAPAVALLLAGFLLFEALRVGATVWLSVWTDDTHHSAAAGPSPPLSPLPSPSPRPPPRGSLFFMGWYAAISALQLAVLQANYVQVASCGIRAGRVLHDALLGSLLRAPMSFFHITPTGRIINRLTKDTADIDRNLAGNLAFAFRALLQLLSTVALIAVGAPFALPALVAVMGVFWALYGYFMASMRQAKRLEAVSRSPVLSSVSEAIAGAATIRAFGIEHWLTERARRLVDKNAATSLLNQSLNRWLSVRLECLGALCTLLAALVTVEQQAGSAATMGLLLTYALQITVATSITLRVGSMAEQTFNAVERVDEYCHLPEEAAHDEGSQEQPPGLQRQREAAGGGGKRGRRCLPWRRGGHGAGAGADGLREPLLPLAAAPAAGDGGVPARPAAGASSSSSSSRLPPFGSLGSVEFKDVSMRYRPGLPLVLRGLSFSVSPGWKVGVVGRTGAGKSSLIGALFRLVELESGAILVDGRDARALALRQLRSAMALIPQVPVLFTGSIRDNLAPFGGHTDAALWSALRRAHLAPVVEGWAAEGLGGLDYQLGEGGSPLSAGQKQLLALARALLNPAKILVLDEATAAVDVSTDALIQETLSQEFRDRTLLAVAHRLHTVIESDRVLVMERGQAVEYGAPAALLEDDRGHFTGMVRETGEATERFLRSMAAGDAAAQRELQDAAAAALAELSAPCAPGECLPALAAHLAQGVAQLGRQLEALLAALEEGGGGGSAAAAAAAARAAALPAAGLLAAVPGYSGAAPGGGGGALAPSATGGAAGGGLAGGGEAAALQQIKAALAASCQLQQLAAAAQQLLGAGGGGAAAGGSAPGGTGQRRHQQLEEALASCMSGASSPFGQLQQQLSGSLGTGAGDATPLTPLSLVGSAGSALPMAEGEDAWGAEGGSSGGGLDLWRRHSTTSLGAAGSLRGGTGGAAPRLWSFSGSSGRAGSSGGGTGGGDAPARPRRVSLDLPARGGSGALPPPGARGSGGGGGSGEPAAASWSQRATSGESTPDGGP